MIEKIKKESKRRYHTEWTKNHSALRLNKFSSDPSKDGDLSLIGCSIMEVCKARSYKLNRNDIKKHL